jgi:hypothetical protein
LKIDTKSDRDGDGIPDYRDYDNDNDGIPDILDIDGGYGTGRYYRPTRHVEENYSFLSSIPSLKSFLPVMEATPDISRRSARSVDGEGVDASRLQDEGLLAQLVDSFKRAGLREAEAVQVEEPPPHQGGHDDEEDIDLWSALVSPFYRDAVDEGVSEKDDDDVKDARTVSYAERLVQWFGNDEKDR